MQSDVARFMGLFRGNSRSFGQFHPKRKTRMETEKSAPSIENFKEHIVGAVGIGVVPIRDDGTCYFGAIDIDRHDKSKPEINLETIRSNVSAMDLPLTVCRSKSGGAHLYLFCSEPIKAKIVIQLLSTWSRNLGFDGAEIFPKQAILITGDNGEKSLGNWINLPYFAGDDTDRYAWEDNGKSSLDFFLTNAESRRIDADFVGKFNSVEHPDAPPCIQAMLKDGVGNGYRNEALYSIVVYLKRAFPDEYREKAFDINTSVFATPLPYSEAKKTIDSASRRQYHPKCKEEPCRSHCNPKICLKRKFGISKSELEDVQSEEEMPEFTDLCKHTTDPVKWEFKIDGRPIVMVTADLMSFPKVRERAAESLVKMIPPLSMKAWNKKLSELMANARVVEAPDDASTAGILRAKLDEFVQKADFGADVNDVEARSMLSRGLPVVQDRDGMKVVYFRGSDFVEFLKRTRSEEMKGANLWMALKDHGVCHTRIKVQKVSTNVWYLPINEDGQPEIVVPDFDPGF